MKKRATNSKGEIRNGEFSGATIRATLSWNGAVLKCSHSPKARTSLFARDEVSELQITYEPLLVSESQTVMLSQSVLMPKNRRLRFRVVQWLPKGNLLRVVLRRH
jgi:hypothetical protein